MTEPTTIRLVLIGFGAVNKELLNIIIKKADTLKRTHNVIFELVGACDSKAAVMAPNAPYVTGLDMAALLQHKEKSGSLAGFLGAIDAGSPKDLAELECYDVLVEATLANAEGGEPGLTCVRTALGKGRGTVLANKGPLVKDFEGLQALAEGHMKFPGAPSILAYSATVCGGLPVLNVGTRDLPGATIRHVQGTNCAIMWCP